jgi:hypothetical protein
LIEGEVISTEESVISAGSDTPPQQKIHLKVTFVLPMAPVPVNVQNVVIVDEPSINPTMANLKKH